MNITKRKLHATIFERLFDQFHQNTFEAIMGENSQLKTYSVLKTEIGSETYLTDIKNIKHRCAMTKLRLSDHPVLIESGRHSKIECLLRFCPFCPTIIEDKTLTNGEITNIQKFHLILKQNDLKMTAKFIYDAFEARRVSIWRLQVFSNLQYPR